MPGPIDKESPNSSITALNAALEQPSSPQSSLSDEEFRARQERLQEATENRPSVDPDDAS